MKNLTLGAVLTALLVSPAFAFGPSPSDANPPGALFQSKPDGWNNDGSVKNGPTAQGITNSAPVRLNTPKARTHR